ncbi:hypothetical protein CLV47_11029 [Antricoccus suffuscus]|uniref:Uncharacterized protein n=1 Tax=Antricoccus suffuscus TaxID=1629062 RepID=A0A2T0ZY93_9ACTN|nr:hypothetical protein CLV47_11029 [Antricoccus suffuscus]
MIASVERMINMYLAIMAELGSSAGNLSKVVSILIVVSTDRSLLGSVDTTYVAATPWTIAGGFHAAMKSASDTDGLSVRAYTARIIQ